ncbi:MAG: hypothetical protein HPY53_12190 [Brevinematales bacterium]|nr:hypothetical protein [Brevinematales bacterium]
MGPFGIQDKFLEMLDSTQAVDLFRELLWAEGSRSGIGRNLINTSLNTTARDGGLDAVVISSGHRNFEIIPKGYVGYQIKTGRFSALDSKKELHRKEKLSNEYKSEIRKLIDNNGYYILVLFDQLTASERSKRLDALREDLYPQGFTEERIRLYSIDNLVGFINLFPALVKKLNPSLQYLQHYEGWGKNYNISNPHTFTFDGHRRIIKEEIIKSISNNIVGKIFRITGLSGKGKTRLIYEILNRDDLKNLVMYIDIGNTASYANFINHIVDNENISCILVVDECSIEEHNYLRNRLYKCSNRIVLITLSTNTTSSSSNTVSFNLEGLDDQSMLEFIKMEYQIDNEMVLNSVIRLSQGYPIIAKLIAENFIRNPGATFIEIADISPDGYVDKLIVSDYDRIIVKALLSWIAVFGKVGIIEKDKKEYNFIREQMGNNIVFESVLSEQKRRGILTGQYYLQVTPYALQIYFIQEWWQKNETLKNNAVAFQRFLEDIIANLGIDSAKKFIDNFKYIGASTEIKELIKVFFDKNGILDDLSILDTPLGADFFFTLSKINPEASLACLERNLGGLSIEELQKFSIGRRYIVFSLEWISAFKDYFYRSAELLKLLALAENEGYDNNATGVFKGLFSTAWGSVGGSELPPNERLPYLYDTFNSKEISQQALAIQGFKFAINFLPISRMVVHRNEGNYKIPKWWHPLKFEEWFNPIYESWKFLIENYNSVSSELIKEYLDVLVSSIHGSISRGDFNELIFASFNLITEHNLMEKKELIEFIMRLFIHKDEYKKDIIKFLEATISNISGDDFHSRIERYVYFMIYEDAYSDGNYEGNKIDEIIDQLAVEIMKNPGLLKQEYNHLMTECNGREYYLGIKIGNKDTDYRFLSELYEEQKKEGRRSVVFFSGYLNSLHRNNENKWNDIIHKIAEDDILSVHLLTFLEYSGINNLSLNILLDFIKTGKLIFDSYSVINEFNIKDIDNNLVIKLLELFLDRGNYNELVHGLNIAKNLIKKDVAFTKHHLDLITKILTHNVYLPSTPKNYNHNLEYGWLELSKQYLSIEGSVIENLMSIFVENIISDQGFINRSNYFAVELANIMITKDPDCAWKIFISYAYPFKPYLLHLIDIFSGGFFDRERDNEEPFILFGKQNVFNWINEQGKERIKRAELIAYFLPKILYKNEKPTLLRDFIVEFGNSDEIMSSVAANCSSGSWVGNASQHYQDKIDELNTYKSLENNPNVLNWIKNMIESFQSNRQRALIEEEREDF